MKITRVVITPLPDGEGPVKATASVYLDGSYAVNGILVLEDRERRVRIRFPFVPRKEKREDGKRYFAFAPLNAKARWEIEERITREYRRKTEQQFPS